VQSPLLTGRAALPFAVALFISNVMSTVLLNYLVPWVSNRFVWWLRPAGNNVRRVDVAGIAVLVVLYAATVLAFWRLF
jgi:antibiotic biosynthesis monooxygenase (ABM) superfamily enzyme